MSKPINALFIFDANYLSPALVSVSSFFEMLGADSLPVTLVYLVGEHEKDAVVRAVLQRFATGVQEKYPQASLQLIEMKGNLFSAYVKRHHFSNAILYKAIVPSVFAQYEHILLLDCGMIFGKSLREFVESLRDRIQNRTIATIAAFSVPSDDENGLPAHLKSIPHNSLYPTGGTLYFDVARYNGSQIFDRFVAAFNHYREHLIYAEQDLLCLILNDGELSAFDERGVRCHIDLASADWSAHGRHERLYKSRNYFYIKHVGSFKPWKKWVLHPSKALFLKERKKLVQCLGLGNLECLQDDELFPENLGFIIQQLVFLEAYYSDC